MFTLYFFSEVARSKCTIGIIFRVLLVEQYMSVKHVGMIMIFFLIKNLNLMADELHYISKLYFDV